MYVIRVTRVARRHLDQLPDKVRGAALETVHAVIAHNPQRVGKPLLGELAGLHSARRGDYRVVYEILEDQEVVVIHRIQHRRDVYRSR
ncbi:MAG: type II toxin-antitoxin system RelE/ParE family toxin [Acidimicrobiia bacterium]|nr:type II toxin-antitoxin system RelE/ParE family toxin [Actinomycetota bacterium]MBL6925983.1 type II toxin-antitoxin system RelE/ParE family toxin [Acidimicrobiia bacterium]